MNYIKNIRTYLALFFWFISVQGPMIVHLNDTRSPSSGVLRLFVNKKGTISFFLFFPFFLSFFFVCVFCFVLFCRGGGGGVNISCLHCEKALS